MATVANFNTDNDTDDQSKTTTSGQGLTTAASAPPSTSGQSGSAAPQAPTSNSSGNFQNIGKYINANKDFNSANGGLAGNVTSGINNQAQNQQQNIQGAQNTFNQQAQSNVNSFNNLGAVNQAATDPYGFIQNNPNGVQQVQAAENAQYTGPQGFQDLSGSQNLNNLSAQNQNLNNLSKETQSQSGQFNLLKNMVSSPTYTSGQQSLDQAIMSSAPGAQKAFAQARGEASQAGQNLNSAQQQAQQAAQQNQQLAQQVGSTAKSTLNNVVGDVNTQIGKQLQDLQSSNSTSAQQVAQDVYNGNFNDQDLKALGAASASSPIQTAGSWYGLTPDQISQYVTGNNSVTAQQAATSDQYNKIAALNQLLGNNASQSSQNVLNQFTDPTQAGTAGAAVNLNSAGLTNALQNAESGYRTQLQAIQPLLQRLNAAGATGFQNTTNQDYQNVMNNIGQQGEAGALQSLINSYGSDNWVGGKAPTGYGVTDNQGTLDYYNDILPKLQALQSIVGAPNNNARIGMQNRPN